MADEPAPGPRPFWSGTISFGLVSVPVDLYAANRSGTPGLRMLDEDGTPLARRFYCPAEERDVHPEHIVRGYPIAEGQYVLVTGEELEAVEPRKSRDIDLRRFVPAAEIPPLFFERAYFLAPASESTKAYRLLAEVMERTGRAGIATFVMREREYLIAILAEAGILRAETLRFQDEVRTADDVGLPEAPTPAAPDVQRFERAIQKLSADALDAAELKNEYARRLRELAERKQRAGVDVVTAPEATAEEEGEVDVVEVIRRSLRALQGDGHGAESTPRKAAPRREPALARRRPIARRATKPPSHKATKEKKDRGTKRKEGRK